MGRPREFDIDEAVAIAADLFWRKGFDGASVQELTQAIGVSPPSFYFAFKSKEALFRRAVDDYGKLQAELVEKALGRESLRAVVETLLLGYANLLTDQRHAPGCLILNNALPIDDAHPFRRLFADQRKAFRLELERRIKRAKGEETGLPARLNAEALARLIVAAIWGFAVEAQSGASRADLRRAAIAAVAILPIREVEDGDDPRGDRKP